MLESHAQYNTTTTGLQASLKTDVASPAFQFSVLTCARTVLATKTIYADGKEIPFGHAKHFQFAYRELELLEDFAKALDWLATEPNKFIIRGQLKPGLGGWQRRLFRGADATIDCVDRQWIALDLDGVGVPYGLGAPDKLVEAGYHIRDKLLPAYFRGIRCVVVATASTGRKGPTIARLRLYFLISQPAPNEALSAWCDELSRRQPSLRLDPSVMLAMQPIYTARPVFKGLSDPVPEWGRVRLLDGYEDYARIEVPRVRKKASKSVHTKPNVIVCTDMSPEMLELTAQDAGRGVYPIEEAEKPTDKAWKAIRRMFELLDGCPKPGGDGRHKTMTKVAYELACLVAEGELPRALARKAYFKAVRGIRNGDGAYDAAAIKRRLVDAFNDVCGRQQ